MTVSLQILTDRNKVMLTWSDFKDLIFFSHRQNPNRYMLNLNNVLEFERNLHWWVREWQYILSTGAFNLTNNQTVIDIGSGVGILPLILNEYLQSQGLNCNYFLVDKEGNDIIDSDFTKGYYGFTNSWNPFKSVNVNTDNFTLIDPGNDWNHSSDLIFSRRAWCYHFPYDVYRQRMLNSLNLGGKLYLDVYHCDDVINRISEDMNSEPVYKLDWSSTSTITKNKRKISTCLWIRH